MSAAVAEPAEGGEAPAAAPKWGRKKLIAMAAAALLLLSAGSGAAMFVIKKRAEAAALNGEGSSAAHRTLPTFLPLEPFIVNLADRDVERYAQIGITLELDDPKRAEDLRSYMPAIRNGILLVLAHKTSQQLLDRPGKEALAAEIMRDAARTLGAESDDAALTDLASADDADIDPAQAKTKGLRGAANNPIRRVHFSSFIIQ